ncbi:unnamed protein product [Hyaloperonospora brassicae]|uniref:FYVE-type domain-containing protein n=1 Tax=Hyaloperonospora brassicae TaxID=162125 RepID=A0AAV0T2K5_HYABA|nr:unnamed protein product [Hyaloperonospora brassicae]
MATRMTETLLQATDLLGTTSWTQVHAKHGIALFQAQAQPPAQHDSSSSSQTRSRSPSQSSASKSSSSASKSNPSAPRPLPCNVHAVCKFASDIRDVAASLVTATTPAFKRMMATLSSDFVDGAVVQTIVAPSALHPHRYVGLKWAAFKRASAFAKDRDLFLLEYVDLLEDAQGHLTALRVLQSVECPPPVAAAYAASPQRTRELVPLMGFLYHSTPRTRELRLTYTCTVDTPRDVAAIQTHVEKCIRGIARYTENFRVAREALVLPQQVVPMSERDRCRTCRAKFGLCRRRYNCLKCGDVCCSSCSAVRAVHVPTIGTRELRVCTACVVEARHAARDVADIDGEEEDDDDVLRGRQSCDTLLDPVRSRLIEYKTFSSAGSEDGSMLCSGVRVSKTRFPTRSFSDGLVRRNKALFAPKRRGSPADLAISIEAFRLYQQRMGTTAAAARRGEDGSEEHDNTDNESTTSSSSMSPTAQSSVKSLTLHDRSPGKSSTSLHSGRSRLRRSREARGSDEPKLELNEATGRSKNIISATSSLVQQARKLSHHRILALQQEHEFMAPMLRSTGETSSHSGLDARRRCRNSSQGSDVDVTPTSGSGAVLYSS